MAPGCGSNCTNHGKCMLGKCFCDPMWGDQHCGKFLPPKCPRGKTVDPDTLCSGRGFCSAEGKCSCYVGFSGDDCFVSLKCHDDCNSHGVCFNGRCQPCDVGRYRNASMASIKCVVCPTGSSSEAGSSKCLSCEAGMYSDIVGEACKKCDAGLYRKSKTIATSCSSCDEGRYQNEKGQASCLPCIPGSFMNITGALECFTCGKNEKSEDAGAKECEDCGVGEKSDEGSAKW